MDVEGYFYLGRVIKPVGLKGEILVYLDVDEPDNYSNLDLVYVFIAGNLVPFRIEKISLRSNKQALIKLEGIDSTDATELLLTCSLHLPLSLLIALTGNRFYYHEIIGFEVYDEHYGYVGIVRQVLDYPRQALIQVFRNDIELLIPVTNEIISHVDRQKKRLDINAPEGLIDLYLNP